MDTQDVLEQVAAFASKAHSGQKRKYTDEDYIAHPMSVLEICREYNADICILGAAILHDVLEDTAVSKDELAEFLNKCMAAADARRTLLLVEELTDVYTKDQFPKWNRRKRKAAELERLKNTSGDSQTVKYADIIDNCKDIAREDPEFAMIFLKECRTLLRRLKAGDAGLHRRATEAVNKSLAGLQGNDA